MEWQPVYGHEAYYEVSRLGDVRKIGGPTIGQWNNDQGYLLVRLSRPRLMARVHRLVAEAFIPNPNGLPIVNHIDCDLRNNSVENLEWCTQADNLKHMEMLGRRATPWAGRRSPNASLSDDQVRLLREARTNNGTPYSLLGAMFGISKRAAMRCVSRESYADVR